MCAQWRWFLGSTATQVADSPQRTVRVMRVWASAATWATATTPLAGVGCCFPPRDYCLPSIIPGIAGLLMVLASAELGQEWVWVWVLVLGSSPRAVQRRTEVVGRQVQVGRVSAPSSTPPLLL